MNKADWASLVGHDVSEIIATVDLIVQAQTDIERMDHAYYLKLCVGCLIGDLAESMEYGDYLKTMWWRRMADRVKRQAGYTCLLCGAEGKQIGGGAILHAHHTSYHNLGSNEEAERLVVLCADCHARHHGKPA